MNQPLHCKTLSSPHPVRLLLGSGYARFCRDGPEITIKLAKKSTLAVSPTSLTHDRVLVAGIWFATLSLQTDKGPFKLRWLNKQQAQRVLHWLRSGWLTAIEPQVVAAAQDIRRLLSQSYPTSEGIAQAQQLAIEATALFGQVPQAHWCQHLNLSAFHYLSRISQMKDDEKPKLQQHYVQQQLEQFASYFDTVESMPLTRRQREACVINETNNLVLAGAGTGKTSVMIGRAGYLITSSQAQASDILMLAFGNKAAAEMQQRADKRLGRIGIEAKTFHKLGQEIIIAVEGKKPSISPFAEDEQSLTFQVDQWFEKHLGSSQYRRKANRYFRYYLYPDINPFDFKTEGAYLEYIRAHDLRTLQGERVKSMGELQVANYLYCQGIQYQYETAYEIDTATASNRQYQPDFYLPQYGIYIEYYGIDRKGRTPPFIDQEKYKSSMQWKKQLHEKNATKLIELFHYQRTEGTLDSDLAAALAAFEVSAEPRPDDDILTTLRERGEVSQFSNLLKDLLLRYRANCYDLEKPVPNLGGHVNQQLKAALELLQPILDDYRRMLDNNNYIDFDDMIGKAIQYVRDGSFKPRWRHILVDEFQDISEPRARLLHYLKTQTEQCSLFCVGDDWQAIYRFAGSDLSYTTRFETVFGATATTRLDQTFRFNNSIGEIASRFVTRNPNQINKTLTSLNSVDKPAISLLRKTQPVGQDVRLETVLHRLEQIAQPGSSVYMLARYRHYLPDDKLLKQLARRFPTLKLIKDTIHSSKGKEADYVVILGLETGEQGFPSQKQENSLLTALLPALEDYAHAEERRLFYVALTRAKHRVYLITDMTVTSEFIVELLDDDYPLETEEFETSLTQKLFQMMKCIKCKTGSMVSRTSDYGLFFSCNNFPLCNHKESACPQCQSQMYRQGRFRCCVNHNCKHWIPCCPECAADMRHIKGPYGDFWGCSNYRNKQDSCTYKEKNIEYDLNWGIAEKLTV